MKPGESCYGVSMVRMKSQYTLFPSRGLASGDQPCPGNITCTKAGVPSVSAFVWKISSFSSFDFTA